MAAIAGSIASSILLGRLGRLTMLIGTSVMAVGLLVTVLVLHAAGASLTFWQLAGPLSQAPPGPPSGGPGGAGRGARW